jgi:hypothetical protein
MAAPTHTSDEPSSGRRRILAGLGICLLVPLSAGFGLTVPLPDIVERVAGSLLSGQQLLAFDEESPADQPRGVPIVLTGEEARSARREFTTSDTSTSAGAPDETVVVPAAAASPGSTDVEPGELADRSTPEVGTESDEDGLEPSEGQPSLAATGSLSEGTQQPSSQAIVSPGGAQDGGRPGEQVGTPTTSSPTQPAEPEAAGGGGRPAESGGQGEDGGMLAEPGSQGQGSASGSGQAGAGSGGAGQGQGQGSASASGQGSEGSGSGGQGRGQGGGGGSLPARGDAGSRGGGNP